MLRPRKLTALCTRQQQQYFVTVPRKLLAGLKHQYGVPISADHHDQVRPSAIFSKPKIAGSMLKHVGLRFFA